MSTTESIDLGLRALLALGADEHVVQSDEMPWIPYPGAEGVFVKPLRLDRKTGVWANLTRGEPNAQLGTHYHVGPVTGFTLEGSWRYLERDWVARPGTLIREPAGDIHTLVAGPEGMTTLFILEGALLYIDEEDGVVGHEDVLSFMKIYLEACAEQGIEPLDLDF